MLEKPENLSPEETELLAKLRKVLLEAQTAEDIASIFRVNLKNLMGELKSDIFRAQMRVDAVETGEGDLMIALNF